jgi:hypothetical protein
VNFVRHHAVLVASGAVALLLAYAIIAVTAPHDVTVDFGLGLLAALVAISVVWDIAFHGKGRS